MIDDQTAQLFLRELPNVDEQRRGAMLDALQEYRDSAPIRAAREQQSQEIRDYYRDNETLGGHWTKAMQEKMGPFQTDPAKDRAAWANVGFLALARGKTRQEIAPAYEMERSAFAAANFQDARLDDLGFYNAVARKFTEQEDRAQLLASMKGNALSKAFEHAVEGRDPSYDEPWLQWKAQAMAKPGFENRQDAYLDDYSSEYLEGYRLGRENRDLFAVARDLLVKQTGREGTGAGQVDTTGPALEEAAKRLNEATPEQQQAVYGMLAAWAKENFPDKPGEMIEQIAETFRQYGDALGRGAEPFTTGLKRRGEEASLFNRIRDLKTDPQLAASQTLTGEKSAPEAIQSARKQLGFYQIYRQLNELAKEQIDPIRPVVPWVPDVVERGLTGAVGSVPYIAAASVPYVGMAWASAAMSTQEYDRLRLQYPDMPPEQAALIADTAGIIMGAIERFQAKALFGRLPVLGGVVEKLTTPTSSFWKRMGISTVAQIMEQNLQEAAQDITPQVVQEVATALSDDVPDVDWKKELAAYAGTRLETFIAVLPFALIGAGVGSVRESRAVQAAMNSPQFMQELGISAREAEAIAAAPIDEKDALFQAAWQARTEAAIERGRKRLEGRMKAAKEVAQSPVTPNLEAFGNQFRIVEPDGSVSATFDTEEAAVKAMSDRLAWEASGHAQAVRDLIAWFAGKDDSGKWEIVNEMGAFDKTGASAETVAEQMRIAGYAAGADPASVRVFGTNVQEVKEEQFQTLSRIYQGATVEDVVEERVHHHAKKELANGSISLKDAEKAVRAWLGDKAPAKLTETEIHEGVAKMGVEYFLGNFRRIESLPASVRGFLVRMARFFRDTLTRAAQLLKLKKEGKIDADWEAFLARAVGLEEDFTVNRAVELAATELAEPSAIAGAPGDPSTSGFVGGNPPASSSEEKAAADKAREEAAAKANRDQGMLFSIAPPDSRAQPTEPAPSADLGTAKIIGPVSFSIEAFHGTPHKVDRFSTEKIGTGEGAQAYGWGLYFAEEKAVAEDYKKRLTDWNAVGEYTWRGNSYASDDFKSPERHAIAHVFHHGIAEARKLAKEMLSDARAGEPYTIDSGGLPYYERFSEVVNSIKSKKEITLQQGKIYTVHLDVEHTDLLDWDKPLEKQPPNVRVALKESGILKDYKENLSDFSSPQATRGSNRLGSSIYSFLEWKLGSDKAASQKLASVGIFGIRYLDQGSRDKGRGTRNLVLFDDSKIKITAENGQPVTVAEAMQGEQQSFSIAPANYAEKLAARFDELRKSPERRIEIYTNAKRKLADLDRSQRFVLKVEKEKLGASREEIDRTKLLQNFATLEAIVNAMPREIRAEIGGSSYAQLVKLSTSAARTNYLLTRIEKLDAALEKLLKQEFTFAVKKLFARYRPDRDAGEKPKGKLGADAQQIMDAAEAAMKLTGAEWTAEIQKWEAIATDPDTDPENAVLASRIRDVLQLTGDWKQADAARMEAALEALTDVSSEGWAAWRLKQLLRTEERRIVRENLRSATGKAGVRKERVAAEKAASSIFGRVKAAFLSLSSFAEVMDYAFGKNSKESIDFQDRERAASNRREDDIQAITDKVADFFTNLAGSVLGGERLRFDLAQRTIDTKHGKFSPLEAITAILMWRQEDGRRHMQGKLDEAGNPVGEWHYDQKFVDDLEAALSPEAQAFADFLRTEYAAEYEKLNALYRQRHGISLPAHEHYSPLTVKPVQTKAGEVADPLTGTPGTGSVLTPGFLRTRSSNAVAEPDFKDALHVFIAHRTMLAHWAAYYDLATEMNATLNNREVMNSVTAAAGPEAVTALRRFLDYFAQGGVRDSAAGMALTEAQRRMIGRASQVALFGRLSVLMVQATQLAAASVKMPSAAYLFRLSRLLSGNLGWGDAIQSDFMQRRLKQMLPLVRQAMERLGSASKPNAIKHAAQKIGQLINGADGLFTAGTYAILLDWHRGNAVKMGMTGPEAERFAHAEAARDTEAVAQPTRGGARSLAELTATHPMTRAGWAFASEARQKIALWAWSLASKDPAYMAKVSFLTFIVGGLFTQVLKNLWRDMKGDDDEEKWSAARLTRAALTGPLTGIPFASALQDTGGNLLSSFSRGPGAVTDLLEGDQSPVEMMQDVDTLLSAMGLFSDNAAAAAVLSHMATDAAKLLEAAAEE